MIHVVIGTKAQLIKMAPLLYHFDQAGIEYNYISTGQHKDTIADILANFSLKSPDYHIYQGKDITSIVQMGLWMLKSLWHVLKYRRKVFAGDKNGIVLVHGDTFSTLLGALMAKIGGLKVGHVESGLRSFKLFHPFPEEITRILTFWLSDYFFCSGAWAMDNVAKFSGTKINTEANTLYDALNIALPAIKQQTEVEIPTRPYAIITLHRYENIYNESTLLRVVEQVETIAKRHYLLFILHKPTEQRLRKFKLFERLKNNPQIELRQRYDYFQFLRLILDADFLVSDGGSNQEECFYLGKPILLLRKATERHEGLGKNCVLSKYQPEVIEQFITHVDEYRFSPQQLKKSPCQVILKHTREFSQVDA